jgi:hypothetical protein
VNKAGGTWSFVHIISKDPTFQCPRLLRKVNRGSQSKELDKVLPGLDDIILLGSFTAAEFVEGGIPMLVIANIAAAAAATTAAFDGARVAHARA